MYVTSILWLMNAVVFNHFLKRCTSMVHGSTLRGIWWAAGLSAAAALVDLSGPAEFPGARGLAVRTFSH